jgi:nitrogen fixation protein NifB
MEPSNQSLFEDHPCFSTDCQPATGRVHLPVAPRCNIFCRFCSRGLTGDVDKPGQALRVISPDEALAVVDTAMALCPDLRVAGVAGPGDPLASDEALDTLIAVRRRHPRLINCLSTNGLALADSMPRILEAGVKTLTVTVNSVHPGTLERLNRGVISSGRFIGGLDGAEILIDAQERGVRLAKESGLVIKVNTVLAPGINDGRVGETAAAVRRWGADLLNVIALIPGNALADVPAPTDAERGRAFAEAGAHLPVKRNCRRCRADACGVPGLSEYSREIYRDLGVQETFSHG